MAKGMPKPYRKRRVYRRKKGGMRFRFSGETRAPIAYFGKESTQDRLKRMLSRAGFKVN